MKSMRIPAYLFAYLIVSSALPLAPVRADRSAPPPAAPLLIDFPEEGSIFPADIVAPKFLWHETADAAKVWRIELVFSERARRVRQLSQGEKLQVGPPDTTLVGFVPPTLTPEQAAQHTWKPDPATWETIKKHSKKQPVTLVITGFQDERSKQAVSIGRVTFQTSADPVGAPIFYRDVPLIPPSPEERERGVIKPLADSILPKIKWGIGYVPDPH